MYLNKRKVKTLMEKEAGGNYREFARQLGVDVAQLHRVLNTESKAGPKLLGKLKLYCDNKGFKFDDFIFLNEPLHVSNEDEISTA